MCAAKTFVAHCKHFSTVFACPTFVARCKTQSAQSIQCVAADLNGTRGLSQQHHLGLGPIPIGQANISIASECYVSSPHHPFEVKHVWTVPHGKAFSAMCAVLWVL